MEKASVQHLWGLGTSACDFIIARLVTFSLGEAVPALCRLKSHLFAD